MKPQTATPGTRSHLRPQPANAPQRKRERGTTATEPHTHDHAEAWILFRRRVTFTLLADCTMLALAAVVTHLVLVATGSPGPPVLWHVAFSAFVLVGLVHMGVYSRHGLRTPLLDLIRLIVSATALATMAVIALSVILDEHPETLAGLLASWVFGSAFLLAGRIAMSSLEARQIRHDGGSPTLIVGAGKVGHLVAHRLLERHEFGLRPIGFLDPKPLPFVGEGKSLPVFGDSRDLERVIADWQVENVIFTFSTESHDTMLAMMKRCEELGLTVSYVPRLFEATKRHLSVEHIGGLPIVTPHPNDPKGWQFTMKYTTDRIVAALLLLILAPLMAAVAIAVKLSTGGPVLFRQVRVGVDGRIFKMLKFRTMKGRPRDEGESDADWAEAILHGDDPGDPATEHALAESKTDANESVTKDRRTRVGRVLRRTSLDELPQLLNVLRGEMSLIGPRPERAGYVRRFEGVVHRYSERQRVRSGITGWAQVHGLRGKTSLADRVEWDNYYIEHCSPWLDFKIALMTVATVFGWHPR